MKGSPKYYRPGKDSGYRGVCCTCKRDQLWAISDLARALVAALPEIFAELKVLVDQHGLDGYLTLLERRAGLHELPEEPRPHRGIKLAAGRMDLAFRPAGVHAGAPSKTDGRMRRPS